MAWLYGIVIGLHALAAVVWVGGMFFAHVVLRPALAETPGPERLALLGRAFPRFFRWVWAAVAVLLLSGYGLMHSGHRGGLHVDVMQATGLLMMANYTYVYFLPFRRFRAALARGDMAEAAARMGQIRPIVAVNLGLGLFTVFIGVAGSFVGY